jgi:Arm DNA-binding domain
MHLTDAQCRAARPRTKVQELSDQRGLYLNVTPSMSELWRMDYRYHGEQRTAAFGAYPDVSPATARLTAADLKEKSAAGIDPAAKEGQPPAQEKCFRGAAREWFNSREAQWV